MKLFFDPVRNGDERFGLWEKVTFPQHQGAGKTPLVSAAYRARGVGQTKIRDFHLVEVGRVQEMDDADIRLRNIDSVGEADSGVFSPVDSPDPGSKVPTPHPLERQIHSRNAMPLDRELLRPV